jgi:hypothetical protein
MSEVLSSPFKKPECTDMHQSGVSKVQAHIRDLLGGLINFQVVGTDSGVVGPVVGPLSEDYAPTIGTLNPDGTFFIVPETDNGIYYVVLADGTQFTITATQSHAYLGQWYPARLLKVLAGTTGDFSVGY